MSEIKWNEKKVYGTLGKVGVATPAGGDIAVTDFQRWLHPDILVTAVHVPMVDLSPSGLKKMSEDVLDAVHLFRDWNPVDLAFLSCTSGSLIGGKGYDAYLCDAIQRESGAKQGYTTTTAVLKALRALNAKKITIVTPYPDDVNEPEKEYFEAEGFIVNSISGIQTANPRDQNLISKIEPETIYTFAVEHMDAGSDLLFCSCTGLHMFEIVGLLEDRLGVPVISSNLCAAWLIGKYFGKHGPRVNELGELFKH